MQLFLRHIVEKDAFAQQRIVSVMLTDVKENGAVVFLGKLYNIIPGVALQTSREIFADKIQK